MIFNYNNSNNFEILRVYHMKVLAIYKNFNYQIVSSFNCDFIEYLFKFIF